MTSPTIPTAPPPRATLPPGTPRRSRTCEVSRSAWSSNCIAYHLCNSPSSDRSRTLAVLRTPREVAELGFRPPGRARAVRRAGVGTAAPG
ncbi:hypothetical protein KCMC57_up17950 [Kitasatospora sp. CMC57]|uniref:Uncharacterized protein n=1 Tax=Kitasatospora sp. CMC57 TaxID=3231513 RepID=A0AB33JVT8_9ACTN